MANCAGGYTNSKKLFFGLEVKIMIKESPLTEECESFEINRRWAVKTYV